MKRIFILFALFIALSYNCLGQNKKETRLKIDNIKNDTSYYWAESGLCSSLEDADNKAVDNLLINIADNYKADAIYLHNGGDQKQQLRNITKTFQHKVKEGSEDVLIDEDFDNEKFNSMRYMKKSDFRRLCKEREAEIIRFIDYGIKSEDENTLCLEDALRFYYWSLMLCYAHPNGNKIVYQDVDGNKWRVDEFLIDKIDGENGILNSFRFIVPKEGGIETTDDGIIVNLKVSSTSGKPVSNLRYRYHNGRKYRDNTVRDGKTTLELIDKTKTSFNVRIDYEYISEAESRSPEVSAALKLIKEPVKFSNVSCKIDLSKLIDMPKTPKSKADIEEEKMVETFKVNENEYLIRIKAIEQAFRDKNYESVRQYFSEDGYKMMMELKKYGEISVVGKPEYQFVAYNDEVICRSIPMSFDFKSNNACFNRDVVFRFDAATKKVTSIAFRLSDVAENDIIKHSNWDAKSRLTLICFLEDYQTAYALKRIDYLKQIFSENALIIVGHVLKENPNPVEVKFNIPTQRVEYIRQSKTEYMERLENNIFKNNDYINLRFTETDFKKAFNTINNKDIYGIRVRQEYYSTKYGDVGYLFLYVDLTDSLPSIHVRAWQPDKTDLDELMKLGDIVF